MMEDAKRQMLLMESRSGDVERKEKQHQLRR
jgi:hypothetical protein